ncbi:serine/threonine-protein kinase [Povalibacter sp.]|uniref:CHASE2 domain-containing serine/threonine-protein kinase n=1 Tax=Povalibacter sp. TaxID=1962978 RepID=UPI002F3F905B
MASRLARFSWLPGGIAAAAVIAIGELIAPSPFAPLELAAYDRAQRVSDLPSAPEIVLIDVDDRSIAELGPWPWPNNIHADLIHELHEAGTRVIAFTTRVGTTQAGGETDRIRSALALLEASHLGNSAQATQLRDLLKAGGNSVDPEGQFAAAINTHGNVILPVDVRIADGETGTPALPSRFFASASAPALRVALPARISQPLPAPLLNGAGAIGHLHLAADDDGALRSDVAAVRIDTALLPSLAMAIATKGLSSEIQQLSFDSRDAAHLDSRTFPLEGSLLSRPHYFPSRSPKLTHYSYVQVLRGNVPMTSLRDKIVLVGRTDADTTSRTASGSEASMNEVTASTVASLMRGASFRHSGSAVVSEWLVALAVILFAAFILPVAGPGLGALATALLVAILAITEVGLLGSNQLWVQLVVPAAAAIAGYVLYLLGEMVRRANMKSGTNPDPTSNLRTLGQTFQRQGQLDLAFETYRRCPLDAPTMELLYFLGMDFERRRQNQKASAVYSHIATRDPNYRDLRSRRARVADDRPVPPAAEKPRTRPAPAPRVEDWSEDPFAEQRPASLGRKLGRYELERELGKGAMGIVYLGRDPNINRVVAIKAIPLADEFEENDLEEARARFFREAEMAGRLNHPAIVTVYDAGEDQGLAYIAMEYLRGQHLSSYTDSAKLLPPKTVMTLVATTAEALHYAHRQNVVHRDIKPANIMFNAENDELKITDFGIARLTDTSRTKTGIVLGTPSFMSPEQLEGRSLDGRSDQFALGVSLYQLLTGQLPFRAESMPRLMQKIATEPHTPIRLIRPELPEAIDVIIDRVLAKSADDRYATCAEFAADLRTCAKALEPAKPAFEHEWLLP